jgi:hypothetical protein
MRHAGGAGREDRHVRAALALQPQLVLHAVAQLIVADFQAGRRR